MARRGIRGAVFGAGLGPAPFVVLQAWRVLPATPPFQPGTHGPDLATAGLRAVAAPGPSVLIADGDLLSPYSGAARHSRTGSEPNRERARICSRDSA